MKNLRLLMAICAFLLLVTSAKAQVHVNVDVNIGSQPAWGPTGYDRVEYYYLPDIDSYYYVPQRQFIYLDGGRWIIGASLPIRYCDYDLYRGYKVVINEPRPWLRDDVYRVRYYRYRQCYGRQPILRDCRDGDDDDDQDEGPGHGRGRGHAYGHYKHHRDED